MKYYCGIDLHSRDCFLCVIDDNEGILVSNKLPNDLKMILEKLCQFDSMPIVAVESTLKRKLTSNSFVAHKLAIAAYQLIKRDRFGRN